MAASAPNPGDPFALPIAPTTCLTRAAFAAARPLLSAGLGATTLRRLYARAGGLEGRFEARALRVLGITLRVEAEDGAAIPPTGPLIVAANHPTGGAVVTIRLPIGGAPDAPTDDADVGE